jgi:hypothetical protein
VFGVAVGAEPVASGEEFVAVYAGGLAHVVAQFVATVAEVIAGLVQLGTKLFRP